MPEMRCARVKMARCALLLTVCLGLAACGDAGPGNQPSAKESTVATFDYSAWKPETAVSLPKMSEEEFERARLDALETSRATFGVDPALPVPDLVRRLDLGEDMQPVADCMISAGYPVELSADGRGINGKNLSDSARIQVWLCMAQYTPADYGYPEETPEQRAVKYEYYTTFFVPCAQAQGVKFVQEPPSKEAWIASLDDVNSEESPWMPDVVGDAWSPESRTRFKEGSEALRNLYEACPALPPAQYYYGQ